MTGNGKRREWDSPDRLAKVERWCSEGLTIRELAHNMGLAESTVYDWLRRWPEFAEAVKRGREQTIVEVENVAFRLATGKAVEEQIVKVRDADGGETVRKQMRRLPPNATMLIFLLKNRAGYSDNPNANPAEKPPTWYYNA